VALYTPRAVLDSNGQKRWEWAFDRNAFGTRAANEDPAGTRKPFEFNLRFPGQYYDAETGLHYNYFRDYEPGVGRYVQSDPIGLVGGESTYAYGISHPISNVDYYGLFQKLLLRAVLCELSSGADNLFNGINRSRREGYRAILNQNLSMAEQTRRTRINGCQQDAIYSASIGKPLSNEWVKNCSENAEEDYSELEESAWEEYEDCVNDIPPDIPFDFEFCVFKPIIFDGPRR